MFYYGCLICLLPQYGLCKLKYDQKFETWDELSPLGENGVYEKSDWGLQTNKLNVIPKL